MAQNLYCSCGEAATRFCTCSKPNRIYFCDNHCGEHVMKPGAHSFIPVESGELDDPDLLNLRSRHVIEYKDKLQQLSSELFTEWHALGTTITELYNDRCKAIWTQYEKVQMDVHQLFTSLWETLETTKKEVEQLQSILDVKFSEDTEQFLSLCFHPEKPLPTLISARAEVLKGLKEAVSTKEPFVAAWACSATSCSQCKKKAAELRIAPLSIHSAADLASCFVCCSIIQPDSSVCPACGSPATFSIFIKEKR